MADSVRITVNRYLVGFLSVAFLGLGGFLILREPQSGVLGPSMFRIGIVLGALWIALPTKTREAAWARVSPMGLICMLAALLAITSPRFRPLAPILIVLAIVGFLLKPRGPKRTSTQRTSTKQSSTKARERTATKEGERSA